MSARQLLGIGLLSFAFIPHHYTTPSKPHDEKTVQTKDTVYTFHNDVLPLLQSNCNPCHFSGGKVYKKLPFDDYKTVVSLGKKLTTRLKQKEQQAIINGWIGSGAKKKD
ncbi:MAG: hypothetical protein HY707_10900 [Ignavibacteriae bacterium]|nr:hypothetical protein [Ignavibacteriota bacterium]